MRVNGQIIDEKVIARIQEVVETHRGISRRALSRRVCEVLKWRSENGRLKEVRCRVLLSKLEGHGLIRLPAARRFSGGPPKRRPGEGIGSEPGALNLSLREILPVEVIPVADGEGSQVWNDLMGRHHVLGVGVLVGAQLRYLIRSAAYGWLGGLSFSAAAWKVQARDQWMGWSDEVRERHLHRVVNNSRFLILPQVHVPHLASYVLGQVMRRLGSDWRQRYGYEPFWVETFVDRERFLGTCYRAANWVEVGETRGRGRQDRFHRQALSVKRVFMYALKPDARWVLSGMGCGARRDRISSVDSDWAEAEFGDVRLRDRRLNQRLLIMARDFYARPQAQIPQACQSRAKTKAAYRFLKHPETEMDVLMASHREATCRRMAEHAVVLAVQDTTTLNYSAHPLTADLGPIGSRREGSLGLMVHDTMAFSLAGTPLGLLDVQCWARDAAAFGKKHQRKERPIEEKESAKWLVSFRRVAAMQAQCPQTRVVSVGDRESDIYELFHEALQDPKGPQLLVRARQDRLLAEGHGSLWSYVAAQPLAGIQEIQIPRRGSSPSRIAGLGVRFSEVVLKPPSGKSVYGPLKLWAVLAEEEHPPADHEPLCWMLLTTCPVTTGAQAAEKLDWYTHRWGIEVYHKTLKSGCKIEERQLGDAATIEACLAIDMVVAWRIYHLVKLGRETPDVPCTVFFEEYEWKALKTFITRYPYGHDQPPSLREAIRMVASLGGFLGRKGDGEPGTKSIWLGLQRLDDISMTYKHLVPYLRPPPVSSTPTCG